MCTAVVAQWKKIQALQSHLSAIVHTDGVKVDEVTHKELTQIINAETSCQVATGLKIFFNILAAAV